MEYRWFLACALNSFEGACQHPGAFRTLCRRIQEEHPQFEEASGLVQWFLEPTDVGTICESPSHDSFSASLSSEYVWHTPWVVAPAQCRPGWRSMLRMDGTWGDINLTAPRMLRQVSGSVAMQRACVPTADGKPCIRGLLFWKAERNYLRLDRGAFGRHEVSFAGCLRNQDVVIGRGRLPPDPSDQVILRLERRENQVRVSCSSNGEQWFSVGHTARTAEDPVEVGLHAIGAIDRTIYHGAYPGGTAIRFREYRLWGAQRRWQQRRSVSILGSFVEALSLGYNRGEPRSPVSFGCDLLRGQTKCLSRY